jgi:two-component system response regulator FlrC
MEHEHVPGQSDDDVVLVVDDEPSLRAAYCRILQAAGHPTLSARDGQEALAMLEAHKIWLVLADLRMPRLDGLGLLREVKRRAPATHVVLISGYATMDSAIEAMRLGAADYLLKPFLCDALEAIVCRLKQAGDRFPATGSLPEAVAGAPAPGKRPVPMIAQAAVMKAILATIETVAASQATILIQGESGTGKEVLARHIHGSSARASRPFVAVNCAALPDGLLESELFGYERGAFTGAVTRRSGKFEQAHGGTLLLDEISEMSLSLQAKLLRVIQEREVDRLGGKASIHVDIRIIATTNRSLRREVAAGRFREDLFYRLNVFPVTVPPLRDRPPDIPALAAYFVRASAERNGKVVPGLSPEAERLLLSRSWSGNVRELENVIERAVLLATGGVILSEHIASDGSEGIAVAGAPVVVSDAAPVSIWAMERELILRTLERVNGNRTHAAKILDISIRTLRNKLREYRQLESGRANSAGQGLPAWEGITLKEATF